MYVSSSCQKLQTLENIMGMIVLSSMYNFFFLFISIIQIIAFVVSIVKYLTYYCVTVIKKICLPLTYILTYNFLFTQKKFIVHLQVTFKKIKSGGLAHSQCNSVQDQTLFSWLPQSKQIQLFLIVTELNISDGAVTRLSTILNFQK